MVQQRYSWSLLLVLVVAVLTLTACGTPTASTTTQGARQSDTTTAGNHSHGERSSAGATQNHDETVAFPHVHGLGFTSDGAQLLIPAHVGMFSVQDGRWQRPSGPPHDYMGFAISDDGFYSSGHPAPSAPDLPNPLGLVKSTDGGQTLHHLGFAGESDFHMLAVGYTNHAIYVLNPEHNAQLGPGMYSSLDDGRTWKQSAAQGVRAAPVAIAVHPTQAQMVALATDHGVLLSRDYGATFARIGEAKPVTAATFTPNGTLLFGSTELWTYDAATMQMTALPAPSLGPQEVVTAIAVNPVQPQELALATTQRNIFQSEQNGQGWVQLARNGVGVTPHE